MRRLARLGAALALLAGACQPTPLHVSAWIVEWNEHHLRTDLFTLKSSPPALREVDFFRYHLRPDGTVVSMRRRSPARDAIVDLARDRDWQIAATVTNDIVPVSGAETRLKDPEVAGRLLATSASRKALVGQLRTFAREHQLDTLDLDFENLHASDRARFTAFVRELARALHDDGRRLAVTVHPQRRAETRDGPGAQDLAALGKIADEIRVMAYHLHSGRTEPGPAAPADWIEEVTTYITGLVSPGKLVLALYTGGWLWEEGGKARQISHGEATELAAALDVSAIRAPAGALTFRARHDGDVIEVWFEDTCTLFEKIGIARKHDLRGVALWHLGKADNALLEALAKGRCISPSRGQPEDTRRVQAMGARRDLEDARPRKGGLKP